MKRQDGLNGGFWWRDAVFRKENPFRNRVVKGLAVLLVAVGWLPWMEDPAGASWLIDPGKYHMSAHGRTSCQDCHEGVQDRAFHPNPEDVGRELKDFFALDHCLVCHDSVLDELEQGLHGSERVEDSAEYKSCLQCHHPHEQLRIEDSRPGRFDPSRPPHEQCGACHEEQTALPALSSEDEACMTCHGSMNPGDSQDRERIRGLCFHCHGMAGGSARRLTSQRVSPIKQEDYESSPHADVGCMVCHPDATDFGHHLQKVGDCARCHLRHDEKVAHDAHIGVTCEACHLRNVRPVRDPESGAVKWERTAKKGEASRIHEMVRGEDEGACRRCHFEGNLFGAAAVILPPKSILCMPCHAATFSVGDTTTVLALIVFLAGMVMTFAYVLTGTLETGEEESSVGKFLRLLGRGLRAIFSPGIVPIVKALFGDVILQRRLYRQSPKRWLIHSLIFWPFVFRFCWGLSALCGSLWRPEWPLAWIMLDKNHPATAFLFDMTGIMVVLGIVLAFIRGLAGGSDQEAGLPRQDRLALVLIVAVVVLGFLLEGARMAMTTGVAHGAGYAFVGRVVAVLFSGASDLTSIYGYIWYTHAVLTGIFIAYLPFSRLIHMIMAPIVLAMNAVADAQHRRMHG